MPTDTRDSSDLYIERPPIESICYETIAQPGSLLRIKAPKQMGKTLLANQVIGLAKHKGYLTAYLNLHSVEREKFYNLDRLLQWFCAGVSRELGLPNKVDEFWDEKDASKVNCTDYFEELLLPQADRALVLCLDNVDLVFPYGEVAEDFLALLRSWHEEAKVRQTWKKLRLVVAHSTEVYIKLNLEQSPFNVGELIKLPEFTSEQVLDCARLYELNLTPIQIEQIEQMVGGHPYLVRQLLDRLRPYRNETLEQLLKLAPTAQGIYSKHLREQWQDIQKDLELKTALKEVIAISPKGVRLKPTIAYKLESLGLIKMDGNDSITRCELYRLYFNENTGDS